MTEFGVHAYVLIIEILNEFVSLSILNSGTSNRLSK